MPKLSHFFGPSVHTNRRLAVSLCIICGYIDILPLFTNSPPQASEKIGFLHSFTIKILIFRRGIYTPLYNFGPPQASEKKLEFPQGFPTESINFLYGNTLIYVTKITKYMRPVKCTDTCTVNTLRPLKHLL